MLVFLDCSVISPRVFWELVYGFSTHSTSREREESEEREGYRPSLTRVSFMCALCAVPHNLTSPSRKNTTRKPELAEAMRALCNGATGTRRTRRPRDEKGYVVPTGAARSFRERRDGERKGSCFAQTETDKGKGQNSLVTLLIPVRLKMTSPNTPPRWASMLVAPLKRQQMGSSGEKTIKQKRTERTRW